MPLPIAAVVGAGAAAAASSLGGTIANNVTNWNMNEANLEFARENLAYQKALQKEIFAREDTAYQRTKEDMLKAGLNPLSMNGLNNAGEAIQTTAPQNNFTADFGGIGQAIQSLSSIIPTLSDLESAQVQRDALRTQEQGMTLDNMAKGVQLSLDKANMIKFLRDNNLTYDAKGNIVATDPRSSYSANIDALNAGIKKNEQETKSVELENLENEKQGTSNKSSTYKRWAGEISDLIKQRFEQYKKMYHWLKPSDMKSMRESIDDLKTFFKTQKDNFIKANQVGKKNTFVPARDR